MGSGNTPVKLVERDLVRSETGERVFVRVERSEGLERSGAIPVSLFHQIVVVDRIDGLPSEGRDCADGFGRLQALEPANNPLVEASSTVLGVY
jgi:hypothetical protein